MVKFNSALKQNKPETHDFLPAVSIITAPTETVSVRILGREAYGHPWFNILSRYIVSVQTMRAEQSLHVVLSVWRLFCFAQIFSLKANKGFKTDLYSTLLSNPLQRKISLKINPKSSKNRSCTTPKIFGQFLQTFTFFRFLMILG